MHVYSRIDMTPFTLYIQSAAACGPAVGEAESLADLRHIDTLSHHAIIDNDWIPDTSFIPKRTFRRISRLSKMSIYAAHYAIKGFPCDHWGQSIFCSRYGEMQHTLNVLNSVYEADLVSPMDFSYSVHNTGQGLFSILNGDTRPSTVISARYDAIEQALLKAYTQLKSGCEAVLLVYAEDHVPDAFHTLIRSAIEPLAFGLVVTATPSKSSGIALHIQCEPHASVMSITGDHGNAHARDVLQIITAGDGQCAVETERLQWTINAEQVG